MPPVEVLSSVASSADSGKWAFSARQDEGRVDRRPTDGQGMEEGGDRIPYGGEALDWL